MGNWSSRTQASIHSTVVTNKQFHYFSRPYSLFKIDNYKIQLSLTIIVFFNVKFAHERVTLNDINKDPRK